MSKKKNSRKSGGKLGKGYFDASRRLSASYVLIAPLFAFYQLGLTLDSSVRNGTDPIFQELFVRFRHLGMVVVNLLLLGTNENLVGAHFRLDGPWNDPRATSVPLRALASGPASIVEQGPASLVLQTIPMFMMKGIQAIESMLGVGKSPEPVREEAAVPQPSES